MTETLSILITLLVGVFIGSLTGQKQGHQRGFREGRTAGFKDGWRAYKLNMFAVSYGLTPCTRVPNRAHLGPCNGAYCGTNAETMKKVARDLAQRNGIGTFTEAANG